MTGARAQKLPLDHATLALTGRLLREHVRPHFGRLAVAIVFMVLATCATAKAV